jgi:hypothetical protein
MFMICPPVGNPAFVASYDALVPHTFRFVNDGDLVTGVPKFRYMPGMRGFRYKVSGHPGSSLPQYIGMLPRRGAVLILIAAKDCSSRSFVVLGLISSPPPQHVGVCVVVDKYGDLIVNPVWHAHEARVYACPGA